MGLDPEYIRRTEAARLAIRGEAPPPFVLDARLGTSLDLVDGRLLCPRCGGEEVELLHAVSQADHAGIFMKCASCQQLFALEVGREGKGCTLRTVTPRG